jgi:hypothetical protein
MSNKSEKSRLNSPLFTGITGGLLLAMGLGVGNSATPDCVGDTVNVPSKIDSLLKSQLDTAATTTRLGFQVVFPYPSDREIMRITDSCNRENVRCTGPDTVLDAYWETLEARLMNDYDVYSSASSNGKDGLASANGVAVGYASNSTILAITKECYIASLRAYPQQSQPWVGLRPLKKQILPSTWTGGFNLLGCRSHGPFGINQLYFFRSPGIR